MNSFDQNLLRMIAAQMYVLVSLQVSRDMFGKAYTALSETERAAVNKVSFDLVSGNYTPLTPDFLQATTQNPMGFGYK